MLAEWQLWSDESNILSKKTCDELISVCLEMPGADATVGGLGEVNRDLRRSRLRWLHRNDERFTGLRGFILDRFETANRDAFGVDINYLPSLQFTSYYGDEEGCFNWHMDTFFSTHIRGHTRMAHRKLSCVIMLSDPESYEGGSLELEAYPPPDAVELRKQGAMIIFPSLTKHRVTPVTSGARHTLVAWMEGPPWR